MRPVVFRALAITIAVTAVIDPAFTSERRGRPDVAVLLAGASPAAGDSALADRVARVVGRRFNVIRAPFPAASATVVIGNRLPYLAGNPTAAAFAVIPDRAPSVAIQRVFAPQKTHPTARTAVDATVRIVGGQGRKLTLTLVANGVAVDQVERDVASNDEQQSVPLLFIPGTPGTVPLRISARLSGERNTATADVAIDVRDERWSVLFLDRRPSWMSTFVRRALEEDARFVVTSRIVTSRTVSTDAGQPPGSINDWNAVSQYDVIVAGAPESLTERDVAGLDTFLRKRGGSVFILFDHVESGAYSRLVAVNNWSELNGRDIVPVKAVSTDSNGIHASQMMWPVSLPPGSRPIARSVDTSGTGHPVVWQSPVGAGRLVVSGALDAWRFRDSTQGGFENFWRGLIADAAQGAPSPIEINLASSVVRPNAKSVVRVTMREASLAAASRTTPPAVSLHAALENRANTIPLRLWPGGHQGVFNGSFRAPAAPGRYEIAVNAEGTTARATLTVLEGAAEASPDQEELVAGWAESRGGAVIPASRLNDLVPTLLRSVQPDRRRETSYPMRSPWWILPFVLLLGAEWWMRRREGRA